jgi:hypothetical protein
MCKDYPERIVFSGRFESIIFASGPEARLGKM